jgi:hypothetical protein
MEEITLDNFLKSMLVFFQDIDKQIEDAAKELSQVDLEQQDILHYIENNTLRAGEYAKFGKLLKNIRIRRREIKTDLEILCAVRDNLTRKYNNKFIEKDIIGAIKGIEAIRKRKAKYTNKTNILDYLEKR